MIVSFANALEVQSFVNDRLDEEEMIARATENHEGPSSLEWARAGKRCLRFDNRRTEDYEAVRAGDWDRILIARDTVAGAHLSTFVAHNDPVSVLRRIEAMRETLEILKAGDQTTLFHVMLVYASIWKDHPEYGELVASHDAG